MQLVRRYGLPFIVVLILGAAFYFAISVLVPYAREQWVARDIKSLGGDVVIMYRGPSWIPQTTHGQFPFFNRIVSVQLNGKPIPPGLGALRSIDRLYLQKSRITDHELKELKTLNGLHTLILSDTQITDAGLEHLQGLTKLVRLSLVSTGVTDSGLKYLEGMTQLELLDLASTQVSDTSPVSLTAMTRLKSLNLENTRVAENRREMLRNALPNCAITPDP